MSDKSVAVDAWESLFRAEVSVLRHLNGEFPTSEISFNEYDVLFNVSRQPERRVRIRDLNKLLLLTQPSVSRLIDRLAQRGLVRKESDPGDGRGTIVCLTEAGYETFRRVAGIHATTIAERVGSALSIEELHQLTELCNKLRLAENL
jgi:DNA-binding MarR family transcriptional regulator